MFAGTQVPDIELEVMADGHYKSRRYSNAGRAQRNIPPDTNSYLGQAAEQVVLDQKQNALAEKQKERQAQVDTATSGQEAAIGPCDAHPAIMKLDQPNVIWTSMAWLVSPAFMGFLERGFLYP